MATLSATIHQKALTAQVVVAEEEKSQSAQLSQVRGDGSCKPHRKVKTVKFIQSSLEHTMCVSVNLCASRSANFRFIGGDVRTCSTLYVLAVGLKSHYSRTAKSGCAAHSRAVAESPGDPRA